MTFQRGFDRNQVAWRLIGALTVDVFVIVVLEPVGTLGFSVFHIQELLVELEERRAPNCRGGSVRCNMAALDCPFSVRVDHQHNF